MKKTIKMIQDEIENKPLSYEKNDDKIVYIKEKINNFSLTDARRFYFLIFDEIEKLELKLYNSDFNSTIPLEIRKNEALKTKLELYKLIFDEVKNLIKDKDKKIELK